MKTYLIEYKVTVKGGAFYTGRIRVKNCMGQLHAKIKLDDYMKRKYNDYETLQIIRCDEDVIGFFSDIFK